jgi:hypothetical protein
MSFYPFWFFIFLLYFFYFLEIPFCSSKRFKSNCEKNQETSICDPQFEELVKCLNEETNFKKTTDEIKIHQKFSREKEIQLANQSTITKNEEKKKESTKLHYYDLIKDLLSNPEAINISKGSNFDDYEFYRLIHGKIRDELYGGEINKEIFQSLFITRRKKIKSLNTFEQFIDLIYKCKNIIVLTGAGCSVSCGIPDFRSKDGIYSRLKFDYPDLEDPQLMFDIDYFKKNPKPFFKFAKEIYPGKFKPSLSHLFIKKLEESGRLLKNYTQNIDTLELLAKINNVIQCHGK